MADMWFGELRRWQEHLSGKLKEQGFVQDERDPCLFVNTEVYICIGVHVDQTT